jgi:hypothetical protein
MMEGGESITTNKNYVKGSEKANDDEKVSEKEEDDSVIDAPNPMLPALAVAPH